MNAIFSSEPANRVRFFFHATDSLAHRKAIFERFQQQGFVVQPYFWSETSNEPIECALNGPLDAALEKANGLFIDNKYYEITRTRTFECGTELR